MPLINCFQKVPISVDSLCVSSRTLSSGYRLQTLATTGEPLVKRNTSWTPLQRLANGLLLSIPPILSIWSGRFRGFAIVVLMLVVTATAVLTYLATDDQRKPIPE